MRIVAVAVIVAAVLAIGYAGFNAVQSVKSSVATHARSAA